MITLQQRVHSTPTPTGWKLNKLHRVLRVRKGFKNAGMQEDNLLSLSYGRIVRKDIEGAEGLLPESFETYQIVEPGNIIMRLTDLQNDKRSLRQGLVTERGIITSAYDALAVERGHDPRFWAYALLALDLAKYYYSLGGGVRQSIKFADFPNDWIAVPDDGVQKDISDFLDGETSRVDALIKKKGKLIAASDEKLSSEIENSVSGRAALSSAKQRTVLEWAPEIPSDWIVLNLRRLFRSADYGISDASQPSGEYKVLGMGHIHNGQVSTDKSGFVDSVDKRLVLTRGDLLFNRTNSRDLVGKVGLYKSRESNVTFASYLVRLRPSHLTSSEYLNYLLNARPVLEKARSIAIPSISQSNLNPNRYGAMQVVLPPKDCQDRMVKELEQKSDLHSRILQATSNSIAKLKEFRTALITAAVSGQIDVSEWSKRGEGDRRLDAIQEEMTSQEARA